MASEEVVFPNNIRNIRLTRGMKMTAVAKRAGLSLSAMSKVEKGVRRLNQKQLLTMCGILGCKLSDIFIKKTDDTAAYWENEMHRRLTENENSGLKIFGAGVRFLRRKIGKTIADAARDAKMTLSVYHKIEVGQREVYQDEVANLARALGVKADAMFSKIADLFKSGDLSKQIGRVEAKTRSVMAAEVADSATTTDEMFGAKLYDNARRKLVPVFGTPGEKNIAFKKSDEKMIVLPEGLTGTLNIYAVIPNVRRLGTMFPARSYLFVNPEPAVQPGDLAIAFDTDFDKLTPDEKTHAQIVMVGVDAKGKMFGHLVGPDERIPVTANRLHKVVQIVME